MENVLELVNPVGFIKIDGLNGEDLLKILLSTQGRNLHLYCWGDVPTKSRETVTIGVNVIEIIPPETPHNEVFFKECFDGLLEFTTTRKEISGRTIEESSGLVGPRWILVGGVFTERKYLTPPPIIMAFYEKSNSCLFSVEIKDKVRTNLSQHILFHPLN